MGIKDTFDAVLSLGGGMTLIYQTAKAVKTGVFKGWYNGIFKEYYLYRTKQPWNFYTTIISMAFAGAFFVALGISIVDDNFSLFRRLGMLP
ncbi:hypothetical protein [Atlantibacter sp.]|uniref:hypothetical protein n=1 Tax=Atlantibacter sp. TaxID=1903473 RepID=UPI0028A61E63|nr:hypothetical protein [Atlantibacter sp.]